VHSDGGDRGVADAKDAPLIPPLLTAPVLEEGPFLHEAPPPEAEDAFQVRRTVPRDPDELDTPSHVVLEHLYNSSPRADGLNVLSVAVRFKDGVLPLGGILGGQSNIFNLRRAEKYGDKFVSDVFYTVGS
jgi:hypothetical protein